MDLKELTLLLVPEPLSTLPPGLGSAVLSILPLTPFNFAIYLTILLLVYVTNIAGLANNVRCGCSKEANGEMNAVRGKERSFSAAMVSAYWIYLPFAAVLNYSALTK